MAKAIFHRRQRVWVEPVGTWALIDKVNPIWAKGFDEPVRVTYDCGLGREFRAEELKSESDIEKTHDISAWRLMRAKNKWHTSEDSTHHPFPGTYPVVVTDPNDWGGWRVPGAEYDRDPALIEMQARLITCAPKLLKLVKEIVTYVRNETEDLPDEMIELAKRADHLRNLVESEAPEAQASLASTKPVGAAS